MTSLKQKTINGMFWSVGEKISEQIALLITSIILARLLEPADFGLLGMISIFIAIAQSMIDSGFGSALIQKKDANQTDASSIFFFNIFLGILFAAALFFAAPLIANFYDQPILTSITRVLSLNLILTSLSLVQSSLLTKEMKFQTQMRVGLLSVIFSGVVGIILAYSGLGVWSLVFQAISRYLIRGILLWNTSNWRPSFDLSFESLASMFSYGSRLLLSGMLETIFNNFYNAFIGKTFSATELGYYSRAQSLEISATQATSSSLSKVTFAAFAPFQDNNEILKQSYRKAIKLSVFIHFPLLIGLIVIADPLIRFLMTDKWAPSIVYFQLLCVSGLFVPLIRFNQNIIKIKGRTELFFRANLISKIFTILMVFLTYRWGIKAIIYGQIAISIITYLLNGFPSQELIGYSLFEQVKDTYGSLLISIIMGGVISIVTFFQIESIIFDLLIRIFFGIVVYFSINFITKQEELYEVIKISHGYLMIIFQKFKNPGKN
jgi:O-antigen/teichoic acid export membrane protein